ncbi:MAG: hypothetical protein LBM93_09720 [Oscillospiraceae bacterium]|nr:hypothetical protein [Oscillospiraceae bacterium]
MYDTGTLVPTDNARVKGTVGAKVNKARQVIYYLNDGSTSTGRKQYQSFSLIALSSNGVEKVSWGAELGKDKATGYVYTRVYNGAHTVNSSTDTNNCTTGHSIVASQDLTITS